MKVKTEEEALQSSLKYFNGDKLAASTFISKYAMRDDSTIEENPDDMHHRLAKEYARIEKQFGGDKQLSEDEIYNLFSHFKYIVPGGSVCSGLGNPNYIGSLSNCFVAGQPEDSYASIMKYRDYQVELMKRRGGVGIDLSKLRPDGTHVNNAARTSSGPVSFMHVTSELTKEVALNGRRGALMISISGNHPDVEQFIECKQDLTKITGANISVKFSDAFMKAVEKEQDYILRWPVNLNNEEVSLKIKDIEKENGKVEFNTKYWLDDNKTCLMLVHAKDVWHKFVHCAWNTAEPGIMYEDKHHNLSPDGVYEQYKGVTTNPCVTGDTMVAVADGRGYVSIKELADKNEDVPVYCLDNNGKLTVSLMRNPRLTGKNKQIYKIVLENGHEIKCTDNHKFLLNDKGYVEAKDLQVGDSMFLMTKICSTWDIIFNKAINKPQKYFFVKTSNSKYKPEHRLIYNYYNNDTPEVIHHIDFNGLNNSPENLIGMKAKEHREYHSNRMIGENNPIFKIKANPERFEEYSKKMSDATSGLKNGNAIQVSNDEIILKGVKLVKILGRMFSEGEWVDYAKDNNLPCVISGKYRSNDLGCSVKEFSSKCAALAGIDYPNVDVRLYKNYLNVKSYDDSAYIENGHIYVIKKCEYCGKEFSVEYTCREKACCSLECTKQFLESREDFIQKRLNGIKKYWTNYSNINRKKQIDAYKQLQQTTENVSIIDFEKYCSENKISHRFGTKNGFKNFEELKDVAITYNHRIIKIELCENEDVYNGTVDNFHNFFAGKFEENDDNGNHMLLSINQLQCGEIFMEPGDSCRLMHINLTSFVNKENKTFDYDLLRKVSKQNMRLCDDLVELELEHVQRIIEHIKENYSDDCKNELELWQKIYETGKSSRRAGCGATGVADTIALLGIKLNSKEGFDTVEKIFQTKMLGEVEAQIELAKERGTFTGYDYSKEFDNSSDNQEVVKGKNEFFENLLKLPGFAKEMLIEMMQYGRRNVSWSTMAPVGTGAIMTQGTSGIEPLFMPYYKRRKKCSTKEDRVDFIDKSGEKFTEFMVVHKPLEDWIISNCEDYDKTKSFEEQATEEQLEKWFKLSPWYNCTANDLTPVEHCHLQSIVNQYITHSISKTVNLPNSTTEEEISNLYMEGWKQNCKGLTVYRDGCRDGILVKSNENKDCNCKCNGTLTHSAPKRPKSLPCDIKRFRNGGDKWIACVGLYQGQPYEIFTGLAEKLNLPENIDKCAIIKNKVDKEVYNDETGKNEMQKVSSYDLMYSDKDGNLQMIENIGSMFRSEFYNVAKMTSGLLRHGMPIDYIISLIKSLDFKNDTINSWKSGVIRALKVYIKDGEVPGEVCPECGAKIIRENGCKHCSMCDWSACS